MQDGEFIVDRWMVGMLRDICQVRGITFAAYSDDWLLELRVGDKVRRVLGYRFHLNDSVAASVAQDKVATYQVLAKADIPAVTHVLVRTKVSYADRQVMAGWQKIVVKPLVGTSGHGVRLFTGIDEAAEHIEQSTILAWAAAPFVDIQREVRVIMLDGMPLITYEKQPVIIRDLKMFNLGLGAIPKDIEPSDELVSLARNAQHELGLRLSTVDIVEDTDGNVQVMEVNDSIMIEYYARHSPENEQRAIDVYSAIVDAMMR